MGSEVRSMKLAWVRRVLVVLLLLAAAPMAQAAVLHLSAAASLRETLNELTEAFARKNPGASFVKNYGGSGSMAQQLRNGAPVDLFICANDQWVGYLKQQRLLAPDSISDLAYNSLVVVGPLDSKVVSLKDLLKLDKIAIGSPGSVPAGEYAWEAFRNAFIEKQLAKKLVMAKDVRECLMYAERGEVDGAVVYRTDARQARKVKILFSIPQNLYQRVTYPMALTIAGSRSAEARAFYRYLQGAEAKAILARNGFETVTRTAQRWPAAAH
jgi:molybdate transport system substrate-binding protein